MKGSGRSATSTVAEIRNTSRADRASGTDSPASLAGHGFPRGQGSIGTEAHCDDGPF